MPRFTPATEAALLAAGWFEGRTVPDEQMNDWLIINWFPDLVFPQGYSRISPKAWQALNEFGGLSIERGIEENPPLILNPLRVPDLINPAWRWDEMAWQLGTDLFPLGTFTFNVAERTDAMTPHRALFMSSDGRVFIQAHPLCCLGNTIEEALERVVAGERGEPLPRLDEAERERILKINNSIHDVIINREKQLMQGIWPDQPTILKEEKDSLYENLMAIDDWDAEAEQICRAFGITEPCVFVGPVKGKILRPAAHRLGFNDERPSFGNGLFLEVTYHWARSFKLANGTYFGVCRVEDSTRGRISASLQKEAVIPSAFAKGLFNLGLLTPKVEDKLKLSITQHEKLEWQLEFEAFHDST